MSQHAVRKYAETLEVVSITLAKNAGQDVIEVLSKLYAKHEKSEGKTWGFDIDSESNDIQGIVPLQIYDSLTAKAWALQQMPLSPSFVLTACKLTC